ncbi:hypothetical protein WICMUC_002760 [Wickerhamomyces mucosus]|uniref:Uncharacterized protein n=1 Tax=Wickerhamomyces mucosus TaxID=1378264 RepID=A0A9P8TEJ7_9ASCO|nr:hypothetical protein WICMUC_002760 [Wickerhamomyces mucosus]
MMSLPTKVFSGPKFRYRVTQFMTKCQFYNNGDTGTFHEEEISLADRKVVNFQFNFNTKPVGRASSLTSLQDFRRNVKNHYNHQFKLKIKHGRGDGKLESLFSIILHSLHYCTIPDEDFTGSVLHFSNQIRQKVDEIHKLQKHVRQDDGIRSMCNEAISLYVYGNTKTPPQFIRPSAMENLHYSLLVFLAVSKDTYDFKDVLAWIKCVISSSVQESCFALQGTYHFPSFISGDILQRVPVSAYEVDLMIDIYAEQMMNYKTSIYQLKNLVFFTKIFKHQELPNLIDLIIKKERKLKSSDYNDLLSFISEPCSTHKGKVDYYDIIIEAERLIFTHMISNSVKIKPLGFLSLALSLLPISKERALRFFEMGVSHSKKTSREYYFEKLFRLQLSSSPDALMQLFDEVQDKEEESFDNKVWDKFFERSEELKLLNPNNSLSMLSAFSEDLSFKSSQSKLYQYISIESILQFGVKNIDNRGLEHLLTKLYRIKEDQAMYGFASTIDAARYIFSQVKNPTRTLISKVLIGESYIQPQSLFDLYILLLEKYCDNIPNGRCLTALMIAALKDPDLRWSNHQAHQVAIHEFLKNIKQTVDDHSGKLLPSDSLWNIFILLLGRYNYQSELFTIFKIWEELKYKPSKKTLGMLLGGLDIGENIRDRNIQHLQVIGYSDDKRWLWPTRHELSYWRNTIKKQGI